ncbi:retrotransposon hot spot (RHS) protein, putative, partial [Trypanosoma cruzi]
MCAWITRDETKERQAEYWKEVKKRMERVGPIPRHVFDEEAFRERCGTVRFALQSIKEESCAVFLMAIEVAPSTRPRHTRMLLSMLEMNRTPLNMMILGLQNVAARSESRQARPLTKEEMNQVIRSRTDWKERVVLRLAWITASRLFEIAALTPNNFTMKPDGALILDWSVAPKTAKADPHRASRFVKIRGQDAFDIIKLCRTLQGNEKLTN